jgi:hypothetical protein
MKPTSSASHDPMVQQSNTQQIDVTMDGEMEEVRMYRWVTSFILLIGKGGILSSLYIICRIAQL